MKGRAAAARVLRTLGVTRDPRAGPLAPPALTLAAAVVALVTGVVDAVFDLTGRRVLTSVFLIVMAVLLLFLTRVNARRR